MKLVKQKIHYWCPDTWQGRITGKGCGIAVLDTGIVPHPDFEGRIAAWLDCVHHRTSLYDDNGHGTHVAGILASDGRTTGGLYAGMAPGAKLTVIKVLDEKGNGKIGHVMEGLRCVQRIWRHFNIRIVNISLGALPHPGDRQEEELLRLVEALWEAGLTVVTAAGNLGPGEGSITIPGCSRKVITAGASDLQSPGKEKRASCSGCGPTDGCVVKPDIVAPGRRIASCNYQYRKGGQSCVEKSGTSMATPIVAGAAALLLEKHPGMTNNEVKLRIWNCGQDLGEPANRQGHGLLHVAKLLA